MGDKEGRVNIGNILDRDLWTGIYYLIVSPRKVITVYFFLFFSLYVGLYYILRGYVFQEIVV